MNRKTLMSFNVYLDLRLLTTNILMLFSVYFLVLQALIPVANSSFAVISRCFSILLGFVFPLVK